MSKVVKKAFKAVKKVVKKIMKNPIFKVIAIAATIYFGGAALMSVMNGGTMMGGVNAAWGGLQGAGSSLMAGEFSTAGSYLSAGFSGSSTAVANVAAGTAAGSGVTTTAVGEGVVANTASVNASPVATGVNAGEAISASPVSTSLAEAPGAVVGQQASAASLDPTLAANVAADGSSAVVTTGSGAGNTGLLGKSAFSQTTTNSGMFSSMPEWAKYSMASQGTGAVANGVSGYFERKDMEEQAEKERLRQTFYGTTVGGDGPGTHTEQGGSYNLSGPNAGQANTERQQGLLSYANDQKERMSGNSAPSTLDELISERRRRQSQRAPVQRPGQQPEQPNSYSIYQRG